MPASLYKQYNEYSDLQLKLKECNITLDKIVEKSGVSKATVARVLNLAKFKRCSYEAVTKVRLAILELKPSFVTLSFEEYDKALDRADHS